jgi:hypothetical protein
LVTNKLPTVADDALKDEYRTLEETAKTIRQTDEHVNFTLLDPPVSSSAPTIEQQLSTTQQYLTHLSGRVQKAQDVLKGLRGGFEWTTRLDPGWSVVEAAKAEAREEEEDADGSEDEDEEEEFEEVAPEAAGSIRTSSSSFVSTLAHLICSVPDARYTTSHSVNIHTTNNSTHNLETRIRGHRRRPRRRRRRPVWRERQFCDRDDQGDTDGCRSGGR